MILYKDNSYAINPAYPNTDFIGNADYVIPDDSELVGKIMEWHPDFKMVLNKEGEITDIIKTDPVISEAQITARQNELISESKSQLAKWLSDNPFLYKDCNYYSCTEEKQSLLNSNLASYERAIAAGIEYPLRWNASGCECVPWDYDELRNLSLCIAAYVAPRVSKQQSLEIKIKSCTTLDEIDSVVISYDD